VRSEPFRDPKSKSAGGGNTTDDSINHRNLVAPNERGESAYRNEHRMQKHFG
jgi:hypothetical protein